MQVIHSAGKPVGFIQKCSRCGVVLQDYTNALGVGDWRPVWWDGNVFVDGRFSGATEEPANCEAAENSVQRTDANVSAKNQSVNITPSDWEMFYFHIRCAWRLVIQQFRPRR